MTKIETTSPNFITESFNLLREYIGNTERIVYINTISHSRYLKDIYMSVKGIKYRIRMEQGYYDPCSFVYDIKLVG
jgi:hypothetical protein